MVRAFPFILKTKYKTLHVKRAWVELENSAEKQSAWVSINQAEFSIDRAKKIYTVNPTEHSIPTLHINTLWTSLKQKLKRFDHGLSTLQIEVLIHLNLKS